MASPPTSHGSTAVSGSAAAHGQYILGAVLSVSVLIAFRLLRPLERQPTGLAPDEIGRP